MVIVRIWEGLGNQMFQYAYARALKEKGVEVRIDLKKAYDWSFTKNPKHVLRHNSIQNYRLTIPEIDAEAYGKYAYLRRKTALDECLCWMGQHSFLKYKFYEEKDILYSDRLAVLDGNYYVKGWFQDQRYFCDIRNILEQEFVPRQKIKISPALKTAMEDKESVALHIRRTDYVKMQNALSLHYYDKAIEEIRKTYRNPIFLIFSDDLEWVKDNFRTDVNVIFVNEDKRLQDYEELFIMSRCKSNIIANSTFSWWAAWLNKNEEKHIVAPGKWFPDQKQLIASEWTVI